MEASTLEFIRKWGQNVNHTSMMQPIVYPVYKKSVIINNSNPELEKVLEPWFNEGKDIIIEVDGNTFSNEDFRHIQNLGGIIGHDEQLKEEELPCEFGLGGLKITINSLDSFEQELINL